MKTMLLSLPETSTSSACSDGDWDIAEGAAFPEFNRRAYTLLSLIASLLIGLDSEGATMVMEAGLRFFGLL
jgi:hypothetical protein